MTAYRPNETQVTYGVGDTINATPVLTGFDLSLADRFSVLDEDLVVGD